MTDDRRLTVVGLGFIGSRIARRAVEDGWTVTALSRRASSSPDLPAVRHLTGDATDADAVEAAVADADWVVYAAGDAKPADSDADPVAYATQNLDPLLHVLRAVTRGGARGLTFLSSGGAVYGPEAPVPTPEDTPLWPASSYGVLKATAEQYVALHARRDGFAADVLRCANVFGPGEPTSGSQGLIGVTRARMRAGEPVVLFGDGSTRRDFLHVDDLADVVVRLAGRPDGLRVLNVGSGHSVSVSDIVAALAAGLGVEPQLEVRPARASDVPVTQLDVDRLRATLEFAPRDTLSVLTATPVTLGQPSDGGPDVSVVVTGHREGELALPTFRALARSVAAAVDAGLAVELVGVLDRADGSTARVFDECLAEGSTIGALATTRVVTTDLGDPGLARNAGVQEARAPWVCVLDADNLPARSWLVDAHRRASEHGGPCVVHPEHLVVFGARWEAWPQMATADPGFRPENFYDRTFWDTFCLASRQVFDAVAYVPTSAASGLGPEDWHWGMETVHAGFEHLVAPSTALLYRVKPASVQQGHDDARSLLPPSRLLVDPSVAARADDAVDNTTDDATDHPAQLRGLQAAVVRPRPERRRRPRALAWLDRAAGPTDDFDVAHYRALNSDALHLDDDAAVRHHRTVGVAEGRRGRLTPEELADVERLRLDDYRTLHPDLAALADDDLLHHYVVHGRVEGRAARMTTEQRDAARPVRLSPEVVAELAELHAVEPDVPEPTPDALAALRHVGPPMDGSLTAGSRTWWDLVRRIGDQPLGTVVFVGDAVDDVPEGAADPWAPEGRVLVVDTGATPVDRSLPTRDGVLVVHARELGDWSNLTATERSRLLATLVVQYRVPRVVVHGSAAFEAAARDYERALGAVLAD